MVERTGRRRWLRGIGAVAGSGVLVGCLDDEFGDERDDRDQPGSPSGDTEYDDENGDERDDVADGLAERFVLKAESTGWIGVEPAGIADEENPRLEVEAGERYAIGWEEGDGVPHNIQLRDENDDVVGDYETDLSEEGGDDQFLEFEATDEIAVYRCAPHLTMEGEIVFESADDDDVVEIEPGERIVLSADAAGWIGVEPASIAGEENPRIGLEAGARYEIGWEEGDGSIHNIGLRDENDAVVDGYETTMSEEGGDDQFLEFEATDALATYRCGAHPEMEGAFVIESGNQE